MHLSHQAAGANTPPRTRAERIRAAVIATLEPETVAVVDDSAHHVGHAGARPQGETHYTVRIVSARFEGTSRVARSRLVHDLLADEFAGGLHALSLVLRTPAEESATTAMQTQRS